MNINYLKYLSKNHVLKARDFFLDLLFPISCQVCGQNEKNLCQRCKEKIIINKTFCCPRCKISNCDGSYCGSCQENFQLNGLWISTDYHDQKISNLIKNFKYHFNKALARDLGDLMLDFLQEDIIEQKSYLFHPRKTLIIPVPLHKRRKRFRGFNQSELLAIQIAQSLSIPFDEKNLTRNRHTKAQAKLSREERLKNVHGAFSWRGKYLNKKNIILIDDVSSTETTLENCANTLKKNGAKEVWGLVLAKN